MSKSPFLIIQDFFSAKLCEDFVEKFKVNTPNTNQDGRPIKLERIISPIEGQDLFLNKFYNYIGLIEEKYNCNYKGTEQLLLQHFPENDKLPAEETGCDNARFFRKKWIKTRDVDLTGFIWLKDYNDTAPLDDRFEVYGGKIEYPAYDFSLTPQRGTMLLFPAGPHFIHAISPVVIGDMYQIKFNVKITDKNNGLWIYNPQDYAVGNEGFLQGWFREWL